MSNCCLNDLGNIPHNETLDTGLVAAQAGEHIAVLFFAGVRIKRPFTVALVGDAIEIPAPFNEDYQYRLQIIQPDGSLLEEDDCENFNFKTYVSRNETCGAVECATEDPEEIDFTEE